MRQSDRQTYVYLGVIALWMAYVLETFLQPFDVANPLHLTRATTIFINITVLLPYLVAWLSACYAGLTLLAAVPAMPDKEDKIAYTRIAAGIFVLMAGFIATSLIGGMSQFVQSDPAMRQLPAIDARQILAITVNWLYVYAPLVGFALTYSGSRHLRRGPDSAELPTAWVVAGSLLLFLFSVSYVWLIFTNPTRQAALSAAEPATYFLSDPVIVTTIIAPFLLACVLGFLAVLNFVRYYRGVTGFIYKQAARNFITGLLLMIFAATLLEGLLSLGTGRLLKLGLGPLLMMIYAFIGLQTFGMLFVAMGAKRLAAIERIMKKYEVSSPLKKLANDKRL